MNGWKGGSQVARIRNRKKKINDTKSKIFYSGIFNGRLPATTDIQWHKLCHIGREFYLHNFYAMLWWNHTSKIKCIAQIVASVDCGWRRFLSMHYGNRLLCKNTHILERERKKNTTFCPSPLFFQHNLMFWVLISKNEISFTFVVVGGKWSQRCQHKHKIHEKKKENSLNYAAAAAAANSRYMEIICTVVKLLKHTNCRSHSLDHESVRWKIERWWRRHRGKNIKQTHSNTHAHMHTHHAHLDRDIERERI